MFLQLSWIVVRVWVLTVFGRWYTILFQHTAVQWYIFQGSSVLGSRHTFHVIMHDGWFTYLFVLLWIFCAFWSCWAELLGMTVLSYGTSACGSVVVWRMRGQSHLLRKSLLVKSSQFLVRWALDPFTGQVLLTVPMWGLSSWHQCKGTEWVLTLDSLSNSGTVIQRQLLLFISYFINS